MAWPRAAGYRRRARRGQDHGRFLSNPDGGSYGARVRQARAGSPCRAGASRAPCRPAGIRGRTWPAQRPLPLGGPAARPWCHPGPKLRQPAAWAAAGLHGPAGPAACLYRRPAGGRSPDCRRPRPPPAAPCLAAQIRGPPAPPGARHPPRDPHPPAGSTRWRLAPSAAACSRRGTRTCTCTCDGR